MANYPILTNGHRARVALALTGDGTLPEIAFFNVGTGGIDGDGAVIVPDPDITDLVAPLLASNRAVTLTQVDAYSVTATGVLAAGSGETEVNGEELSEVGLFDANGDLVAYQTFTPKTKEVNERFEFSIKVRV